MKRNENDGKTLTDASINELLKGRQILTNDFEGGIFIMRNIDIDVDDGNFKKY